MPTAASLLSTSSLVALDEDEEDEEDEALLDELAEPDPLVLVLALDDAVVEDDELSPLLSPAVCEAVSHAARKKVAANRMIRR
ncbi:MAG: hypothetical protein VW836_03880 [Alphaproteobacteria bacterium]